MAGKSQNDPDATQTASDDQEAAERDQEAGTGPREEPQEEESGTAAADPQETSAPDRPETVTLAGEKGQPSPDTLANLAWAYKVQVRRLYAANRETIEEAAQDHGYADSDGGRHLFAGTVLAIPYEE